MRFPVTRAALAFAVVALLGAPAAFAQQVTPMKLSVSSASDRFMAKLTIANPYESSKDFEILAFDEQGAPLAVWASVAKFNLNAGGSRQIMVSAPFDGGQVRQILVCAESISIAEQGAKIHAQVCSKIEGRHL
jgi:hypothetical protein